MTTQLTDQGTTARTMRPPTPATPAAAAGHGRTSGTFHRIRLAIQDMNYASRRVVERQAPWTVDKQWHRK